VAYRSARLHDLVFLTIPRLPNSPLFPYTTLFRSRRLQDGCTIISESAAASRISSNSCFWRYKSVRQILRPSTMPAPSVLPAGNRSEEHTSELQSRENLVCRLLLEKKNNKNIEHQH